MDNAVADRGGAQGSADRGRVRARLGADGDLRIPRQLARDAHSGRHDSGVDHRLVHRDVRARLLGERADAARPGARDRPGRRRCDRRAGERASARGDGRAVAGRCGHRQPRDRLCGHRHHADARGGVRADLVPAGGSRPSVQRVRFHARRLGAVLRAGRADARRRCWPRSLPDVEHRAQPFRARRSMQFFRRAPSSTIGACVR